MSSIASTSSSMVSFRGEDEVPIDEALDALFRDLQSNLNNCQCSVRSLAMSEERADTFLEACEYHFQIEDYVNTLMDLFDELKDISKQALGKCPKEYKSEFKALCEKRKEEKKRQKDEAKQLKQMAKMSLSEIKEE